MLFVKSRKSVEHAFRYVDKNVKEKNNEHVMLCRRRRRRVIMVTIV